MRPTRAGVLATSRVCGCPISSAHSLTMVDSPPPSQFTPDFGAHWEATMQPGTGRLYLVAVVALELVVVLAENG